MKLRTLSRVSAIPFLLSSQIGVAQTTNSTRVTGQNQAKEILTEDSDPQTNTESSTVVRTDITEANMTVGSRFSGQFTTGSGIGYGSSFSSISGFVPFFQIPGNRLFYFNGRANLDTENGDLGGNLLIGYRQYSQQLNTVFGGSVGLDTRDTANKNTFNQIGVGFEALGDPWEFRANGYIPVGDRRTLIAEVNTSTPTSTTTFNFQKNFLGFNTFTPGSTNINIFEESLMGLDIEGGIRLADWGGGNLRGYLGTYLYDTPSGSGFIGFSSRLLAEISDNFNAGVSFTTDGEFGTNVVFTIGASLGGTPDAKADQSAAESVLARLGDTLNRQTNVAIRQTKEEVIIEPIEEDGFVTNPETGDPWFFVHVAPDGNGDGTFEAPVGLMDEAIAAAPPESIIYVDDFAVIPGNFTIPDTVQALSRGPQQFIDTVEFANIQIPLSGVGIFPTVNGTASMGNDTVLSGFTITPPAGQSAVLAENVTDISIRDNIIEGLDFGGIVPPAAQNSAIQLFTVSGNAEILNNTISNVNGGDFPRSAGIKVADFVGTLNIERNTIQDISGTIPVAGKGIHFVSFVDGETANISITDNQISNVDDAGIHFQEIDNSSVANVIISGNSITNADDDAIYFDDIQGNAILNAQIINNIINGAAGTTNEGIEFDFFEDNSQSTIVVTGNTITDVNGDAILFDDIQGNAIFNAQITNNVIDGGSGTTNEGIEFDYFEDNSQSTIVVTGNTITGVDAEAIYFDDVEDDAVFNVQVVNNIINGGSGTTNEGIEFDVFEDRSNSTIVVSENTITEVSGDAILFDDIEDDAIFNVQLTNNVIDRGSATTDEGIEFGYFEYRSSSIVVISGNTITDVDGDAILFDDIQGDAIFNAQIINNIINGGSGTTNEGIEFDVFEDRSNSTIVISGNTITGVNAEAIYFDNLEDDVVFDAIIIENIINGVGTTEDGIEFDYFINNSNFGIVVSGNKIQDVTSSGIQFDDFLDASSGSFAINDNIISNAGDEGIDIDEIGNAGSTGIVTATISGNTISDITSDGIYLEKIGADNTVTLTISDNIVTNVGDNGILLADGIEGNSTGILNIVNNQITNAGDDGINFEVDGAANATVTVTGNQITNVGDDGIDTNQDSSQDFCLVLNGNTVTASGDVGFEFSETGTGAFQIVDRANVLTNNTGTFNPADLNTNVAFADGTAGAAPCP